VAKVIFWYVEVSAAGAVDAVVTFALLVVAAVAPPLPVVVAESLLTALSSVLVLSLISISPLVSEISLSVPNWLSSSELLAAGFPLQPVSIAESIITNDNNNVIVFLILESPFMSIVCNYPCDFLPQEVRFTK
jgi:hypothetical protein